MSLGQNIKACRQAAHLSQEKMAELVGVSRQAVTKWETDQTSPSTENLFKLAEILGVTVDALVSENETGRSPAEQIYYLYKLEEAQKAAAKQAARKQNLRWAGLMALGYLALFLLGRMIFGIKEGYSVLGWLTSWQSTVYLFGWLLSQKLYWYAMAASVVPSALGRGRFGLATMAGFFLGWAAGELLGPRQYHPEAGVIYHYGWATWAVIYLLSIVAGILWEKKRKK